jgi:hypothetical protein
MMRKEALMPRIWSFKFKFALTLFVATCAPTSYAFAAGPIDFSKIPPATNLTQSKATFNDRAQMVIESFTGYPMPAFPPANWSNPMPTAVARLRLGQDIEAINRAMLDPSFKAFALPGTDFRNAGPICRRDGDYDFGLATLINAVMPVWNDPTRLWPETKAKLIKEVLTIKGNEHSLRIKLGACGWFDETENHVLMTEGSRYLTNQLLYAEGKKAGKDLPEYDNERNGFNAWMLNHLRGFLINDFSEYNSKPYQAYSIFAIENLYNHATEPRIKMAAELVLDYLSARYSIQSNMLRRYPPIHRLVKYRAVDDMIEYDAESLRHAVLVGNTQRFAEMDNPFVPKGDWHIMLFAALGGYRVPDLIADMIVSRDHVPYYQRIRHGSAEVYSGSKSFLISAGGLFLDGKDMGTGLADGWAMPTMVIPTAGGHLRSQMVQFKGSQVGSKRFNVCVAPGFACGINPLIPSYIPPQCIVEHNNNWTFLNFGAPGCPLPYTFHVAMYSAYCDSWECDHTGDSYGFMEVQESDAQSFDKFKAGVLARNGTHKYHSMLENTYVTSKGDEIRFVPTQVERNTWSIKAINGVAQQTQIDQWGLLEGDILNAGRDGRIVVKNPRWNQSLVLDFKDPMNPRKYYLAN